PRADRPLGGRLQVGRAPEAGRRLLRLRLVARPRLPQPSPPDSPSLPLVHQPTSRARVGVRIAQGACWVQGPRVRERGGPASPSVNAHEAVVAQQEPNRRVATDPRRALASVACRGPPGSTVTPMRTISPSKRRATSS